MEMTENLENLMLVANKSVGCHFLGSKFTFRWKKYYLGLIGIQILKIIFLEICNTWKRKRKVFKYLNTSGISGFFILSYRANSKRRKQQKI